MQLQTLQSWLPVAVTLIPGIIHQWLASQKIERSLTGYPLFKRRISPRYWALRLLFFALPIILFWTLIPEVFRVEAPRIGMNLKDYIFWGMALALGFRFEGVVNAPISICSMGVFDFQVLYNGVVNAFQNAIIENQSKKSQIFWDRVKEDLSTAADRTKQNNYRQGQQYLRSLLQSPYKHAKGENNTQRAEFEQRLKRISPSRFSGRFSNRNPSHETVILLQELTLSGFISRQQLPTVLKSFDCHRCLLEYFPKRDR